jgi:diguanylate cyclase (GGDEF)-like protein
MTINQHILTLQATTDIPQLWRLFLFGLGKKLKVRQGELVYRAGILFETHKYTGNGDGPAFETHTITNFAFQEFRKDFDYIKTKKGIIFFKQTEAFCAQLELISDHPDFTAIILKETDDHGNRYLGMMHFFLNQLFLLLQIKNFEFHSIKDDITLAYNQNYLKAFIQNEIERTRRYASTFSIVFFDLDNLKAINELHGHLVGTEVLKEVANVLRSQVRKIDLLSRFGGDEFVIVLLHADESRAYDVSLRIQTAMKSHVFLKDQNINIKITGCFGISSFPANGNSVDELIRKADLAMYDVKRTGKDGIRIYKEEGDKVDQIEQPNHVET